MEPGPETPVRRSWKRRAPRRPRAKEEAPVLQPDDLLTERQTDDGRVMGPYETAYDLSSGYGLERIIINP